jgi:hypothetical protein
MATINLLSSVQQAQLPIDGGASGMGILPMSEGWTQTHGQDARATAGIHLPSLIGRCARRALASRKAFANVAGFRLICAA